MKRMGVLVVGAVIIASMMGCLSQTRDGQAFDQQTTSTASAASSADTAAVQGDSAAAGSDEVPSSACDDGVCDDDAPATASEVLSLLASDPLRFGAVMETAFPGYDHDAAESLRQQFLTGDDLSAVIESAIADAVQRGLNIGENSGTSAELEMVGYYLPQIVLHGQDGPNDPAFLASRRGVIFVRAVLDELQGIASAQDGVIQELKTSFKGERYMNIEGAWGFSWISDAYKWVKNKLSDGWKWTRSHVRNLRWGCIAASAGVVGACTACVATAIAAPETAGGSLALAQHACGVACVSAVISAAQACN